MAEQAEITVAWYSPRKHVRVAVEVDRDGELPWGYSDDLDTGLDAADIWKYVGRAAQAALTREAVAA